LKPLSVGLGGVSRGFASLFSSSSSRTNRRETSDRDHDDSASPDLDPTTDEESSTSEDVDVDDNGDAGTDEGTDDDDSLLHTPRLGQGDQKQTLPYPTSVTTTLSLPSEFETADFSEEELSEMVAPSSGEGDANSSDEGYGDEKVDTEGTTSSDEEHNTGLATEILPLNVGGTVEKDLVPRPLGSPVKNKGETAKEKEKVADTEVDDDEGLVEIKMGHGRSGSGDSGSGKLVLGRTRSGSGGGVTAGEVGGRERKGSLGSKGKRASLG
jgi:hypothetical protein